MPTNLYERTKLVEEGMPGMLSVLTLNHKMLLSYFHNRIQEQVIFHEESACNLRMLSYLAKIQEEI